jgi:hypothetical protein
MSLAEKAEKIKLFNDLVENFLNEFSKEIGGTTYHYLFTRLVTINAVDPIKMFIAYAIPLKDKIDKRDESYFTNVDNHAEETSKITTAKSDPFKELLRLKGVYENLSKNKKEQLWDYTQGMLMVAIEYILLSPDKYKEYLKFIK